MKEQPQNCKQNWIKDDDDPRGGYYSPKCPNIKEVSSISDMDGESYECNKCGYSYRLYYEDMK